MQDLVNRLRELHESVLSQMVEENDGLKRKLDEARDWDKKVKDALESLIKKVDPHYSQTSGGHSIDAVLSLEYRLKKAGALKERKDAGFNI